MSEERWLCVVGFPDYEVSDHGRVQSKRSGAILRPPLNAKGYRQAGLRDATGARRTMLVHRLVLEAFVGQRPTGQVGCHANGDPEDNRLINLRWDTHKANEADKLAHGRRTTGERHPQHKLTIKAALEIRAARLAGESVSAIAERHAVSSAHVYKVCTGANWAAVIGPPIAMSPEERRAVRANNFRKAIAKKKASGWRSPELGRPKGRRSNG